MSVKKSEPPAEPPLGPVAAVPTTLPRSRAKALAAVASGAGTVAEVANVVGGHPNMARRHLDTLRVDGLVEERPGDSGGRGRPSRSYAVTPRGRAVLAGAGDGLAQEYLGLAGAFAAHVAATSRNPGADARSIGVAWGAALAHDDGGDVLGILARLGFSPLDRGGGEVALTTCPLLEPAKAFPEVVCQLHLGLVRGASAAIGGPGDGGSIHAFAEPGACVLHLPRPEREHLTHLAGARRRRGTSG